MSFPIRRFELDPTGVSPANRIIGEEHVLGPSRGKFHAIAPFYGPFYNDRNTWTVFKNNVPLEYGKDYFGVVMCNDETMEFNGEIDEVFLVKEANEGDVITVDYQLLGGSYQNHAKGIQDLWNAFLNDDRPIEWSNVINRPYGYNPSYHKHMIDDVIGWQPVIIALERLTNAVILRNVPAFEALINWVLARIPDIVSVDEIYEMDPVDKLVSFNRLLYAARYLNFNAITFRPEKDIVLRDEMLRMNISATNLPRFHTLFWEIEHETTIPEMFVQNSSSVPVDSNEGFFFIRPSPSYRGKDELKFRVLLRQASPTGPVVAESKRIILRYNKVWDFDYGKVATGLGALVSSERNILTADLVEREFVVPTERFWKQAENT